MLEKKRFKVTITRAVTDEKDVVDKEFYTDSVKEIVDEIEKFSDGILRETNGLYINDRIMHPMMLRVARFNLDDDTISGVEPYDYFDEEEAYIEDEYYREKEAEDTVRESGQDYMACPSREAVARFEEAYGR